MSSAFAEAKQLAATVDWSRYAPLRQDEPISFEDFRRAVVQGCRRKPSRPGWTRRPELDGCKDRKEYRRNWMRLSRGKGLLLQTEQAHTKAQP